MDFLMSWQADTSAEVVSEPLDFSISTLSTGMQRALHRAPKLKFISPAKLDTKPGVVSFPLGKLNIPTRGFTFEEVGFESSQSDQQPAGRRDPSQPVQQASLKQAVTRIRPPSDIVKLEDRLFYLLQPPLESIFRETAIHFPFTPFPYQLDGIAFLYPRCHALLGDEMGLGKTMQAITAMRLLLHASQIRRVLLVCPKPLVSNWQREFRLWAAEIPLTVIEGNAAKRRWQWEQDDAVVTIANYELVVRDQQILQDISAHYDLVVLDESQRIKNRAGATHQVVCSISRTRSWAITGTPVENSPEDLVSIFEFISPGYLRSGMRPRALGEAVSDHVLRRTKDRVLTDLPPKMFRDAEVELTPEQLASYRTAEDEGVLQLAGLGESITIQHVFELVLRLKQICNFDPATGTSAKLERLEADLEECAESGRKAIVFSQWVGCLEELKERLARFHPVEYHGKIPSRKRDGVIDRFRDDPDCSVILMSYGAGSVGLNLQFASYVFLFDRWWNPAVEDQAINRAHRIGAAGPVTVTRFLTLGTIEQRIDQILQEKRELFDTIFADGAAATSQTFSRQEIFSLFNLQSPHGPLDAAA